MTPLKNLRRGALSRDKLVNTRPPPRRGPRFPPHRQWIEAGEVLDRPQVADTERPAPHILHMSDIRRKARTATARPPPYQAFSTTSVGLLGSTNHRLRHRTHRAIAVSDLSLAGGRTICAGRNGNRQSAPNASCSRQATTFPRQSRLSRRQRSAARFDVIVELSCKVEQPSGRNKFAAERLECRSAAQCATVPEMPN